MAERTTVSQLRREVAAMTARLGTPAAPHDPLAAMATAVLADAEVHVARMVRRMRGVIPVATEDDLRVPAWRHLSAAMNAFAQRRDFDDREAAWWRAVGRYSAKRGLSLGETHDLLGAAHAAVWEIVTEVARRHGSATALAVVSHATLMWQMFDVAMSWVSEAHRDVGAAEAISYRRRSVTLVTALQSLPDPDAETEAAAVARSLDFDPNGAFLAAVTTAEVAPLEGERAAIAEYGDRTLVLSQPLLTGPSGERAMARALSALGGPVGVGVQRAGLLGAAQSIADAHMAHAACPSLGVPAVLFRDDWLACLALANRDHQEALVADAIGALHADPQTGATLLAFFDHDGNLAAAGAALTVHPNTIAYRIRQFSERTGVDVRTSGGAALGRVALALAGVLPNPPAAAGLAAS